MSDAVTQGQFFEAIQQLQDKIDAKHSSLRLYVGERADKIELVVHAHSVEDAQQFKAITDRLLVIETERTGEKAQAIRHGTWAGILAAAVLSGLLEVIKRVWR